jgi:hypothetical protein
MIFIKHLPNENKNKAVCNSREAVPEGKRLSPSSFI